MRDVLSLTAEAKLTRRFLRFDSICLRCPPFFSLHIMRLLQLVCYQLLIRGLSHDTRRLGVQRKRRLFVSAFGVLLMFTYESLCDDSSNNSPFLFHRNYNILIFLHKMTSDGRKSSRRGGLMFTASAFMSKSRWISSFPPPSLLQIHVYTGYKS